MRFGGCGLRGVRGAGYGVRGVRCEVRVFRFGILPAVFWAGSDCARLPRLSPPEARDGGQGLGIYINRLEVGGLTIGD